MPTTSGTDSTAKKIGTLVLSGIALVATVFLVSWAAGKGWKKGSN